MTLFLLYFKIQSFCADDICSIVAKCGENAQKTAKFMITVQNTRSDLTGHNSTKNNVDNVDKSVNNSYFGKK